MFNQKHNKITCIINNKLHCSFGVHRRRSEVWQDISENISRTSTNEMMHTKGAHSIHETLYLKRSMMNKKEIYTNEKKKKNEGFMRKEEDKPLTKRH